MHNRIPRLLVAALFALQGAHLFASQKSAEPSPHSATPPQAQSLAISDSAVPLTGPWKFSPGDSPWPVDPATSGPLWAQPDFDDSSWTTLDLTPAHGSANPEKGVPGRVVGWTARGFPNLAGYAWYRLRIRIADPAQRLSLKMPRDFDDVYQLYVNGQLAGQFGRFDGDSPTIYWSRAETFPLPPTPDGQLEIAVRFYMAPVSTMGIFAGGGMREPPTIGSPLAMQLLRSAENERMLLDRFGQWLGAFLSLLLAPFVLWIWLENRRELAFLWLFVNLAAAVSLSVLFLLAMRSFAITGDTTAFLFNAIIAPLFLPEWIMVWWYWFGLQKKHWIPAAAWIITGVNIVLESIAYLPARDPLLIPMTLRDALNNASLVPTAALCILLVVVLIEGFRRDRTEAILATVPILLVEIAALYIYFIHLFNVPYPSFSVFGLNFDIGSSSGMLLAFVIGALALHRFLGNRVRQELARQALELDLAQARELQQRVLVPEKIDSTDFLVDVEYHPAQTVGGDFFQTVLSPDGSLLIVIGDVSGKGISAAMLVAVLVGAARTRAAESFDPAALLTVLNNRLKGRTGDHYATCLAAELKPDGNMRIANAGHLAPYLNGMEMGVGGSLPLGFPGIFEPSVRSYLLRPADTLTFFTDGVVEARNRAGELFGFERLSAMTMDSPAAIAGRAREFGQNDDITVLRVVYTAGRAIGRSTFSHP